jgi:hypothetical protein
MVISRVDPLIGVGRGLGAHDGSGSSGTAPDLGLTEQEIASCYKVRSFSGHM